MFEVVVVVYGDAAHNPLYNVEQSGGLTACMDRLI